MNLQLTKNNVDSLKELLFERISQAGKTMFFRTDKDIVNARFMLTKDYQMLTTFGGQEKHIMATTMHTLCDNYYTENNKTVWNLEIRKSPGHNVTACCILTAKVDDLTFEWRWDYNEKMSWERVKEIEDAL